MEMVLGKVVLDLVLLVNLLLLLLLGETSISEKSRSLPHNFTLLLSLFILLLLLLQLLLNWVRETRGRKEILVMVRRIKVGRILRQI